MAQYSRYRARVRVFDSRIQGMFLPGGQVNDEASDLTRAVLARAIAKAGLFTRSGEILRSHRRSVTPTGLYGTFGQVENTARHAAWKHGGTANNGTGYIYAKGFVPRTGKGPFGNRRKNLKLAAGNGYPVLYRSRVQGQVGDPWLRDAANEVLLPYGVQVTDEDTVLR